MKGGDKMSDKEIAMTIVLKMLELNVIRFGTPANSEEDNNRKNVETVCNAYKTVYQTVKQGD